MPWLGLIKKKSKPKPQRTRRTQRKLEINNYSASSLSSAVFISYSSAITSISTSTSFGKREASTVDRAGGVELKYLP